MALGTIGVQDVDNGKIASRVLSAQHGDGQSALIKHGKRLPHELDGAAEHGLNWVSGQGIFDRNYKLDVFHVFFEPPLDASLQLPEVLQHDRAASLLIEGKNGLAAEFLHDAA